MDDILLWAAGAFVVWFGFHLQPAHASESWARVSFRDWPVIPVTQWREVEPAFPLGLPGAVQPKMYAEIPPQRQCNVRRPDGTWVPFICAEGEK